METLLTIQQAADRMGVSYHHVVRLVDDAQACPRTAKWREKRDFVDISLASAKKRTIRINPAALGLPLQGQTPAPPQP